MIIKRARPAPAPLVIRRSRPAPVAVQKPLLRRSLIQAKPIASTPGPKVMYRVWNADDRTKGHGRGVNQGWYWYYEATCVEYACAAAARAMRRKADSFNAEIL